MCKKKTIFVQFVQSHHLHNCRRCPFAVAQIIVCSKNQLCNCENSPFTFLICCKLWQLKHTKLLNLKYDKKTQFLGPNLGAPGQASAKSFYFPEFVETELIKTNGNSKLYPWKIELKGALGLRVTKWGAAHWLTKFKWFTNFGLCPGFQHKRRATSSSKTRTKSPRN